jgi:ABC-2 type transport system permease protein
VNIQKTLHQRYRYSIILLKQLVQTDFKLRYQGSALGYMWTLLRPLAIFTTLFIVFDKFLKIGAAIPNYSVYLLLGILLWSYFTEVTNNGITSIAGKGDLIRKINFPKYVIVLAGSFSALINLFINFIVLTVFMVLVGVDVSPAIFLLPLVLLQLFVFSLSLGFLLSALYVKFRDISYIWEVLLQAAFYATPILYPLTLVPEVAAKILILNPMAQIIQDARYLLVTQETITIDQLYGTHLIRLVPYGIVLLFCLFSVYYFRKQSKFFAEEV